MKKLVIIPAYNEQDNILQVVKDIKLNASTFDYIVINDCSTDNTLKVCIENNINVLNLPINLGIGGAMQTGYKFAFMNGYDVAVQFDGDGQHDAKFLDDMYEVMKNDEFDMVIGSRFINKEGFQSSFMRRLGINFFKVLFKILYNYEITDSTSGLRMVNKKIIRDFCNYYPKDYPEPETTAICLRKDMRVLEVPVVMKNRVFGKSSINMSKSIYYMIKVTLAIIIDAMRGKNEF